MNGCQDCDGGCTSGMTIVRDGSRRLCLLSSSISTAYPHRPIKVAFQLEF